MAGARLLGVLATALAPLHVVAHVRPDPVAEEMPPVRFEAEPPRWRLAGSGGGRIRVGAPPLPGFAPLPLGRGQLPPRRQRGLARDRPPLPGQALGGGVQVLLMIIMVIIIIIINYYYHYYHYYHYYYSLFALMHISLLSLLLLLLLLL